MPQSIKVLLVEDNAADAELLVRELRRAGFDPDWRRVETEVDYLAHLSESLDLVLSDYQMPTFDGVRALELLKQRGLEVPFIIVSATIGEDAAVLAMRHGATDYVLKDRLGRLGTAVSHAMAESQLRRERRRSTEELKLFRTIIDQSNDTLEIVDPETARFLDVNKKGPSELGCSRAEYLALRVFDVDPTVTEASWPGIAARIHVAGSMAGEGFHRRKDGTMFPTEYNAKWVRLDRDYIVTVVRDISVRRRGEHELRATHGKLSHLLEHSPVITYSLKIESDAIVPAFVSDNVTRLLGYSVEEALSRDWWLANLHPDDRGIATTGDSKALIDVDSQVEYRLRHRDGSYRWIEDSKHLICDSVGRPFEVIGVWTDINARKLAEHERRQTEERFEKIFRSSPIAIGYATMDEGRLIEVNSQFLEFYGYSREEMLGRPAAELGIWAEPSARQAVMEKLEKEGRVQNLEVRLRRKSGEIRVVLLSSERLQLTDERLHIVMFIDITDKKQLETELYRALRVESVGRLASGIAHDMNNILAPIMMSAPLLRMGLSPADVENTLATIETSAKRGASLVRQLLIYARGVEGEKGPVRTEDLIDEISKIARETFPRNISIQATWAAGIWPVRGDATQLHQVLLNLCVNARDAMLQGGTLAISAENVQLDASQTGERTEAKPGPFVRLRIADSGMGIEPEIAEKIFDPFFTTKEIGKGTGLGLSTVLGIVKSHGGILKLQSVVNEGSTFDIFLPAITAARESEATVQPEKSPKGNQELILIVDDEESIRSIMRETLQRHNYRIITANDGAQASVAFARQSGEIKLVIADIDMPFMDGVNLVRVVKKISPGMKFIMSSGLSGDAQNRIAELNALGVTRILVKPYTAAKILEAVHGELARL